jgi:hypothetical protein
LIIVRNPQAFATTALLHRAVERCAETPPVGPITDPRSPSSRCRWHSIE